VRGKKAIGILSGGIEAYGTTYGSAGEAKTLSEVQEANT